MKSLLEIFEECKDNEELKQKLLIVIDSSSLHIMNAKILDPFLRVLTTKHSETNKEVAVSYSSLQASKIQADFVD